MPTKVVARSKTAPASSFATVTDATKEGERPGDVSKEKKAPYVSPYRQIPVVHNPTLEAKRRIVAKKKEQKKTRGLPHESSVSATLSLLEEAHHSETVMIPEGKLKQKPVDLAATFTSTNDADDISIGSDGSNSVAGGSLKGQRRRRKKNARRQNNSNNNNDYSSANGASSSDENWDDELSQGSGGSHSVEAISVDSRSSLGGQSYRSYSIDSIGSIGSSRTELSLREMITDIERRARKGAQPPLYVPRLDELPLSLISWNAKLAAKQARKAPPGAHPKINIIGMHQPVQLILAKADERSRKQLHAISIKQAEGEERRQHMADMIHFKMTRAERYAALASRRKLQTAWLLAIAIIKASATLKERLETAKVDKVNYMGKFHAANCLIRNIMRYVKRRREEKFELEFKKALAKSMWFLAMQIRLMRKKRAANKIKYFINTFKGNYQIKAIVHRFVTGAHRIQRAGRNFIVCNRNRVKVLGHIWDRIEMHYVTKQLEKRKLLESKGVSKDSSVNFLLVPAKARIEMEKQQQRWVEMNARMEASLDKHRKEGTIAKETIHDQALKLLLAPNVKEAALQKYIALKRKEFLLMKDELVMKRLKSLETFGKKDAADLLKGRNESIEKTIESKFAMNTFVDNGEVPFLLFSKKKLDEHGLLKIIIAGHEVAESFVVKVRNKKNARGRGAALQGVSGMDIKGAFTGKELMQPAKAAEDVYRQQNIINAVLAAASGSVYVPQYAPLHLHETQKRKRGNMTVESIRNLQAAMA